MKKVTVILLLLLFLAANTGIALYVHWCGGKISSVDIFSSNKHTCKCGKKPMKTGCCKNTTTILKANKDLAKITQFAFKTISKKIILDSKYQKSVIPIVSLEYFYSELYHPPLFKPKVPIYLLDRVLLI